MPYKKLAAHYLNLASYPDTEIKTQFLHDARLLLREVGTLLAKHHDIDTIEVRVNKGGIAVSGDLYGYYKRAHSPQGLFVQISTSALTFASELPRLDHLIIMARTRHYKLEKQGNKTTWNGKGQDGANQFAYPGPTMTSLELARWLYSVLENNYPFNNTISNQYPRAATLNSSEERRVQLALF